MTDAGNPSRYVKLTKDQAPLEEIKPGELNQPIDVPQVVSLHKTNIFFYDVYTKIYMILSFLFMGYLFIYISITTLTFLISDF